MKIHQIGRSMVEMLGVLAIIGVLSVGGLLGYNQAMRKKKFSDIISLIDLVSVNVQPIFNWKEVEMFDHGALLDLGIVSKPVYQNEVWMAAYSMPAHRLYAIRVMGGLDSHFCKYALTNYSWQQSDFYGVAIYQNGGSTLIADFNKTQSDFPPTVGQISTACDTIDESLHFVMDFSFRRD